MASESELKLSVIENFSSLAEVMQDFNQHMLQDKDLTAWVQQEDYPLPTYDTVDSHRARAAKIYQQFQYLDTQAPREIIVCAGFLGASEKTIKAAERVNDHKEKFKQSMIQLRQANISPKDNWLTTQFENLLHKRANITHETLEKMGLARLHLKQCYRKIPILQHAPHKITWTWAHTKAIKRITAKEAYALLSKKAALPGIQVQLAKLAQIPQNEALAIVQELAPHLRTNLVIKHNNDEVERKMIKGPVPILFSADTSTPCPEFKPPYKKHEKDKERGVRSDVKIEPEPFLPAIRAHRYRVPEVV